MIKTTILTQGNAKIVKGEELGYVTKGIHFAPAQLASRHNGEVKVALLVSILVVGE